MKKLALALLSIIFVLPVSILPAVAFAQGETPTSTVDCTGATDSAFCETQGQTGNPLFGSGGVLTKAAQVLTIITAIVAMFILTISGLRLITSQGDPVKIESARQSVIFAVVGIIVALSGQAIISLVLNKL